MQENQPPAEKRNNLRLRRFAVVLIVLVGIAAVVAWRLSREQTEVVEGDAMEIAPASSRETTDSAAVISASPEHESPAAATMTFRQQEFDVFAFDREKHELNLFHKDEEGNPYLSFDRVYEQLKADDQAVALLTNAGIFNPDFSATGMLITPLEIYNTLNTKDGNGNFYLHPNGVFYQSRDGRFGIRQTSDFDQPTEELRIATQSGPMLLIDNEVHPKFNEGSSNLNIRSGVGIDASGALFFAISRREVNFYDFAMLFKEKLNCVNALYLDGFISEMYLPEIERVALESTRQFSGIFAITLKE